MEVQGKIKLVGVEQQVSSAFKKRELVITTDEQYPQHVSIEFQQDKTDLLSNYAVGDSVKVSINLRGREWVNPQGELKHFNTIVGWRVEKLPTATTSASQVVTKPATEPELMFANDDEPDDLPF